MLRRCALSVLALSVGCSPEVITAGYVVADATVGPAADGGSDPDDADGPWPDSEAGWLEPAYDAQVADPDDSGAPPEEAGVAPQRVCFHLPDLLSEDAGAPHFLQEGEIVAGLDQHWSCEPPAMTTVTYARRDGAPLLRAGQRYALAAPAGPGGTLNFYHGNEACPQLWHSMIFFLVLPGVAGCSEVMLAEDRRFLRAPLGKPTPFPMGFTLCEGSCPAP